jgi:hypothetical protein
MIAASRRALLFEAVQWPPLAETVGVSDGLPRHQSNNRLRSTAGGSTATYCHSEPRGRPAEYKPILDSIDKMLGFVPNLQHVMSISPSAPVE